MQLSDPSIFTAAYELSTEKETEREGEREGGRKGDRETQESLLRPSPTYGM